MFEAMSRVLLSKRYGAKLEGKVKLREEKYFLESSEKSLNVVRNDAIEGKKEHDTKAEVISLRREKGRYIENRRRTSLIMGSTFFRRQGRVQMLGRAYGNCLLIASIFHGNMLQLCQL